MSIDPSLVFTGIPSEKAEEFWPLVEPVLLRAIFMTDGRHTAVTTRRAILDDRFQLWCGFKDSAMKECTFAVVTEILSYPTGIQEISILFAAGDILPDNVSILGLIEAWAISVGCTEAQLIGRKGWARVLKDYEEVAVVLRKRLVA